MKKKLVSALIVGALFCSFALAKSDRKAKRQAKKEAKEKAKAEAVKVVEEEPAAPVQERTFRRRVAIYRFSNESKYAKGAFYNSATDPVSTQAVDILSDMLAETQKFILLERHDIKSADKEIKNFYDDEAMEAVDRFSADYILVGSVTSYGRKETGKTNPVTKRKTQTVEVGVSMRLIDARTGQVIYGEHGEGSAETETKTTLGFGGQAGYDETLTDKALQAALSQMVENITNKCTDNPWKSNLYYDDGTYYIDGGKGQNIQEGDVFAIMKRGKKVKNSQTGGTKELPGRQVGTATVTMAEDTGQPENQSSYVDIEGDIPEGLESYDDYIIQEIRK
ncbi:MAG: hypothetical protein IJ828_05995 [Treponema sp.]|nr:hypothetical protein [Treponema sp.]